MIERCGNVNGFMPEYIPHLTNRDLLVILIEDLIFNKKVTLKGKFKNLPNLLH